MPSKYAAHSPPKKHPEREPHAYADHAREVARLGMGYAEEMLAYARTSKAQLEQYKISLRLALPIHDIGKLEAGNQAILCGNRTGSLPYDHIEAGVALATRQKDFLAAWLIRAHHAPGLASNKDERGLAKNQRLGADNLLRGKRHRRDCYDKDIIEEHKNLIAKTDKHIEQMRADHESVCDPIPTTQPSERPKENALDVRLLLSCLVDADHSDTAAYYTGNSIIQPEDSIAPRWEQRLQQLRQKISELQGDDPERKGLRDELFRQCLNNNSNDPIVTCAAPVGLGKTTAVTANLLQRAIRHKLRRIFIIAPFTNVISQTARRLREYLVLEGEDPYSVIVEHHHRADFTTPENRQYAQTWQAPIVVTTAVQFFETLASALPAPLRKLHRLPGSAIFIDEAHACVPPHLMRQTWHWIKKLADIWSCHFVLASGSLVKYWEEADIVAADEAATLPSLLQQDFFNQTQTAEHQRLTFERLNEGNAFGKNDLLKFVTEDTLEGNRLIILNTVQSAAVFAHSLQNEIQPELSSCASLSERKVLHLSTALAPIDRERIIAELDKRQARDNKWKNKDWYLVATSCVEAGVDLDFDFGFRERCSLTSFLQTAGRINREASNCKSILYDFALFADDGILRHPGFQDSIAVFENYWEKLISSKTSLDELSTKAIREEMSKHDKKKSTEQLFNDEMKCNFQQVQQQFKIIASNTITAVVDENLKQQIEKNIPVSYREIQENSVQIWRNKIDSFGVTPCEEKSGIYFWNRRYDGNFLGYMVDWQNMIQQGGWVV